MIFFVISLAILCLWNIRYDAVGKEYLSIERTNSIKGIFIVFVFFTHIVGYVTFDGAFDMPYMQIRKVMGQCVVALFLFYSGYGVYLKASKDKEYVKAIPLKRIVNTLIKFDLAIVLFLIYRYVNGTTYEIKKVVLTFLGWDGIGNSNWYIFCVLWLYFFTYIAFSVFKGSGKAVNALLVLTLMYMLVLAKYRGSEHWWYDTALCYVLGMLYARYREKIESVVDENRKTWLFFVLISIGVFCASYLHKGNNVLYQVMVLSFSLAVVFISMHIEIKNKVLEWLGKNLFELYILQRIPMMIFKDLGLAEKNRYIYVVVCFITTIVIAVIFKKCISDHVNFGKKKELV